MKASETLSLSIGDDVPERRLTGRSCSKQVIIQGKSVQVDVTESAIRALAASSTAILMELELYFSCLVRKQVRFSELSETQKKSHQYTCILPGLYACFRAVTTQACKIADVRGKPPVETIPVKKPGQYVPDWAKIDHRAKRWLGEYGFTRSALNPTT